MHLEVVVVQKEEKAEKSGNVEVLEKSRCDLLAAAARNSFCKYDPFQSKALFKVRRAETKRRTFSKHEPRRQESRV